MFFSTKVVDARNIEDNFNNKITEIQKTLSTWMRRKLSILGKITVIKSLCISKLIHIIQSIGFSEKFLNKINSLFFKFLWQKEIDGKKRIIERVKRKTLCNGKGEGGLNMLDLVSFQNSFLLRWAELLMDPEHAEWKKAALRALLPVGGRSAFYSNLNVKEFKGMNLIKNSFWRHVLCSWLNHRKLIEFNGSIQLKTTTPLFNNRNIMFKKSTLFFGECIAMNVVYVKDMVRNNCFITFDEFQAKVKSPNRQLIYNCLYNAIFKAYPSLFLNYRNPISVDFFQEEGKYEIGRKAFYKLINKTEESYVEQFWGNKTGKTFDKEHWLVAFSCTNETRLHALHWKVISKIYPTAILLNKMKIKQHDYCEYCLTKDTLEHFFYFCKKLKHMWAMVENIINIIIGKRYRLTWENVILGILSIDNVKKIDIKRINLIIMLAKLSVSKFKYGEKRDPLFILEHEMLLRNIQFC